MSLCRFIIRFLPWVPALTSLGDGLEPIRQINHFMVLQVSDILQHQKSMLRFLLFHVSVVSWTIPYSSLSLCALVSQYYQYTVTSMPQSYEIQRSCKHGLLLSWFSPLVLFLCSSSMLKRFFSLSSTEMFIRISQYKPMVFNLWNTIVITQRTENFEDFDRTKV